MKSIKLNHGFETIVDDNDYEELSQSVWHIDNKGYARTNNTRMHRNIMKIEDSNIQVDHRNGDKLDNRRQNIRLCTSQQNAFNRRKTNNKFGFKGVSECKKKKAKKWIARIGFNGERVFLGRYFSIEDAARAYDRKAKELFGEFSALNFT